MAKMTCTRPEWSTAENDPCPCDHDFTDGDCEECSYCSAPD